MQTTPRWLEKTRFAVGLSALLGLSVAASLTLWALAIPLLLGWSPVAILSGSMGPAIDTGDVVLAEPHDGDGLGPGAVIVFGDPAGEGRITHRIVAFSQSGDYVTRGDANGRMDSTPVPTESVEAVGRLLVPLAGKPFVWASGGHWRALLAATLILSAALWSSRWALLDQFDPWRTRPAAAQHDGVRLQLNGEHDVDGRGHVSPAGVGHH